MEMNEKIIKGVQSKPVLYKTNASIEDRKRGWQELAHRLDLKEQFLRTRWHFLSVGYKRFLQDKRVYFKYTNEMEFLRSHLNLPTQEVVVRDAKQRQIGRPEFVITEKDIETESENDEYVFLEVETLEGCVQEENTMEADMEHDEPVVEAVVGKTARQQLEETLRSECLRIQSKKEKSANTEPEISVGACSHDTENVYSPPIEVVREPERNTPEVTNKEMETEGVAPKTDTRYSNNDVTSAPAHVTVERSEDDIFGELVAAMLKRMPADKKKSVKKDVMNLLLS